MSANGLVVSGELAVMGELICVEELDICIRGSFNGVVDKIGSSCDCKVAPCKSP